jgi:hypothetical protein
MHYLIWQNLDPDVIIPLSPEIFQLKMKAFGVYESQQQTNGRGVEYVRSRHVVHGHEIGEQYGEGFMLYSHGIGVKSFDDMMNGFF